MVVRKKMREKKLIFKLQARTSEVTFKKMLSSKNKLDKECWFQTNLL